MHEIDVWLDGKTLSEAQLSTLKANLQQSFKLSETQARLLVNGRSHRIKRSCTEKAASQLVYQFKSWGIPLRVENRVSPANQQTAPEPSLKGSPATPFTLARAGERIPTQPAITEPVKVSTDHLQLLD
ncbi:hypothetical protein N9X48_01900 [Luminiphilus sp.]|nr:hypothetical protein [Luminiphilus sp.]MDB2511415.1 hypothetical protein [Luminiphilus sp.]